MINFIICDDNKEFREKNKSEIDKFMMNYDIDYKCHMYDGYDTDWKKYAQKQDGFKVYILDIKTNKGSGLDAARLIREEYDDWVSMIMIITSHNEFKYEALGKRLMLVDFINKLSDYENRFRENLEICMKNYDNRPKTLKYIYKNNAYNININQIVTIEKEVNDKKCIIKTSYDEYPIPGTLNQVLTKLNGNFIKCYRNMIINLEQIDKYMYKEDKIIFKDGTYTTYISRNKRKEIIEYVRGNR